MPFISAAGQLIRNAKIVGTAIMRALDARCTVAPVGNGNIDHDTLRRTCNAKCATVVSPTDDVDSEGQNR